MKRLSILLVTSEFPPRPHGGIGTFLSGYAEALVEVGHQVSVLEVSDTVESSWVDGVKLIRIKQWGGRRGGTVLSRCMLFSAIRQYIMNWQPDIIEVPDFGGWLPYRLSGTPTVIRLHAATALIAKYNGDCVRPITRWLEHRTLRRNPYWIAPSKFILDATSTSLNLVPQTVRVVPNPYSFSAERLPGKSKVLGRKTVLFAGAVSRRKGAIQLANAMRERLLRKDAPILVYVGKDLTVGGVRTSEIIKSILGPGAEHCVFTGQIPREQVMDWYRKADVFVFPSFFESFGLVYLEAVAAGVPVIASNRSAESEIFTPGVTAHLVDPEDQKALEERIEWVLEHPFEAQLMADRAKREVLPKFTMDRCVQESVAFYHEVIECQRR